MKSLNGVAAVAAWSAIGAVALSAQRNDLPTFDSLYSRNLTAMGGADTLASLTNITTTGSIEIAASGLTGQTISYEHLPTFRAQVTTISGVGEFRQGTFGGVSWSLDPTSGPALTPRSSSAQAIAIESVTSSRSDPREFFPEIRVLRITEFEGTPCYEVSLTNPFLSLFAYYDTRTALLTGLRVMTPTSIEKMWANWKALQVQAEAARMSGVNSASSQARPFYNSLDFHKQAIADSIKRVYDAAGRLDEVRPTMRMVINQARQEASKLVDQLGTRGGARPFPLDPSAIPAAGPEPAEGVSEEYVFQDYKSFFDGFRGLKKPTTIIVNRAAQQQMVLRVSDVTFTAIDQSVFLPPPEVQLLLTPTAEVVEELKSKSEAHKTRTLVFKGFYLGMPVEDATMLFRYYLGRDVHFGSFSDRIYGACTLVSNLDPRNPFVELTALNHRSFVLADASGQVVQIWITAALSNQMFQADDISRTDFLQGFIDSYSIPSLTPTQVEWRAFDGRMYIGSQTVYVYRSDDQAYEVRFYEHANPVDPRHTTAFFSSLVESGGGPPGGFSVSRIRRAAEVLQSFD